jgi:pimeloyl-ACP methyl ester carboxylesterase
MRLSYTVCGSGPVCVFPAPGWGPSVEYAVRTLKPLERFLTMVYLDTRGTGRSEGPPSDQGYRWDQFVEDLDELRRHLGQDRVLIMGHSWASLHALHYALAHRAHVEALVLIGGLAAKDETFAGDRGARLVERLGGSRAQTAMQLLDEPLHSEEAFQRNMDATLPLYFHTAQGALRFAEHAAATRFSPAAWRGRAACQIPVDLTGRLYEITVRTLIMVGSGDLICPPGQSKRMRQGMVDSELLVIEGAGHFPWIEAPGEFFQSIERFTSILTAAERERGI